MGAVMRQFTLTDVDNLALGATLLGAGGGGDPYIAQLIVRQAIEDHGPITIVEPAELDPDGLVLTAAMIGAPTVFLEKIPAGTEFVGAVRALASYLGQQPVAIMPVEVGGMNTLLPLAVAAELQLPVIDADTMRRAFPQVEMTVYTLAGISASPISMADEKGNVCVFETTTNQISEKLARTAVIQLGGVTAISAYSATVAQVAEHAVLGSMTYCAELGRLLTAVQHGRADAYDEFLAFADGHRVFVGKVIDVDRRTSEGFARATVVLEHLEDWTRTMRIEVQNENLIAFEDGVPVITVPDLICLVDHETARPITTETLTYGQRLDVVGLPCAPEWHRPGALDVVGPRAFGYDVDYVPFNGGTL